MCFMRERIKDKGLFVKFAVYKLSTETEIPFNFSYNVRVCWYIPEKLVICGVTNRKFQNCFIDGRT